MPFHIFILVIPPLLSSVHFKNLADIYTATATCTVHITQTDYTKQNGTVQQTEPVPSREILAPLLIKAPFNP